MYALSGNHFFHMTACFGGAVRFLKIGMTKTDDALSAPSVKVYYLLGQANQLRTTQRLDLLDNQVLPVI